MDIKQTKGMKLGVIVAVTTLFLVSEMFAFGPGDPTINKIKYLSDSEKVVFLYYVPGGDNELVIMNTDGSGKIELAKGKVTSFELSPDSKRVVYWLKQGGLWIVDIDGSNGQQVTTERVGKIDWAPNGKNLVMITFDEKNTKVVVRNFEAKTANAIFEGTTWEK